MKKLILLVFFPFLLYSQNKILIIDSESKEPIFGATIISEKLTLSSNEDGLVDLADLDHSVIISAPQYEILSLKKNKQQYNIFNPKIH